MILKRDQIPEKNLMKKYAFIFKSFEEDYSEDENQLSRARAQLCRLGHNILRNGNSSSIAERAFSTSLLSIDSNRYQLRNVFIISIFPTENIFF